MKLFRGLYDSSYNYVKGYSYVMRYINELILNGGVKCVSLLLAISIDSDHMVFFFFFMHADALAELVLKRVKNIVRISFSKQYATNRPTYITETMFSNIKAHWLN